MGMVIVTRHPALVEYIYETGLPIEGVPVIEHATADDVRGQDVIGVLPMRLAALANTVTEIPLSLDPEDRGKELSLERLRQVAGEPVSYKVTVVYR